MNKKQLPTGVRVLLGFVSFLLCIVLFVCSLVTILVADLAVLTSKGGIKELIMDVMFSTSAPYRAPVHAPGAAIPGRSNIRLAEADMSNEAQSSIVDAIYGMLEEQFEGELPLSREQVEEFIGDSTLPEFISDKVAGVVSDVISGESTTTITKDEVVGLLEENKELIENTFQMEFPQEVIESVGDWVEENKIMDTVQQEISNAVGIELAPGNSYDGTTSPTGSAGSSDGSASGSASNISAGLAVMDSIAKGETADMGIAEVLVMVRFITSPTVLLGCIAVCLVLSALLFLTNWGRPNAALRCSGITYLLAGILFLIPTAVAQFAPALFAEMGVAGIAVRKVLSLAGAVSISVTALGLVLIIAGAVVGSVMKKKRLAAAAATATVTADAADLSEALLAEEETTEAVDVSAIDDGSELAEALLSAEAPAAEEAAAEEAEV